MSGPRLRELRSGSERRLAPFTTFGRDPNNLVRLDDASASRAHASVQWDGDAWVVRDLGSVNGTRVGARRLGADRVALTAGDVLTFGTGDEAWEVVSVEPPIAFAWCPPTRAEIGAAAGVLFLPGAPDSGGATVFRGRAGGWVVEQGDDIRAVADGDWLELDGRAWRLVLPDAPRRTHAASTLNLADAKVHLTVSRDWEHITLRVTDGVHDVELGELQCWSIVLLLAQERQRDRGGPEHDQGWVDIEDICKGLAMRRGTVDVSITRARQALADRGVLGSERIVVARRGQRRTDLPPDAFIVHQGA